MFKQDSKFVKHIFWDPELKTCYPLYVTIENQQKIQNDKVFALKTFQQAKSVFLQSEAAKLKKETNLQSKQDEQENSSTNDVNKKRIKKENDDPDEADDNNATKKKLKKETTPIKGEVISDNEVDEKLNENKIIEMLDDDDDDGGDGDDNNDNNKNNDDESSNKVTKKKVKEEEINAPEFVSVQQDESIIPDNNDKWHDASSQQEDNTVNNFEDVSDDNNAKKTNTASRRLTRNRKISNQKPIQRPRRLVTMEKPKIEQFSWNHNDIKILIKSYERHQELFKNQVKSKFFWANIVRDMNKKNIKVDKDICQTKWSSLLKTYNKCKTKLIFPTNFPFYQMMDQVLGQPKSPKN
ncbi:protein PFC0760c-like [Aphidius gifuensis]|uniref:protein PFC0760c-like n=1 Tax=Aphidius gifuensis TaxID=684658 RepID=UPI001CDD1B15|nr:protein PFC0760c-like [Aphidius gifuensis]XP_044021010.1 protein PFC0760c-like [Aphidius gifuensis]